MQGKIWLIAPLAIAAVWVAGCGSESTTTKMQDVYKDVAAREQAHYALIAQVPSTTEARSEVTRYASDMHGMSDRMDETCGCGPNVAMMPDGMGDIHRTMNSMVGMVDRHAMRMMADSTVAAMRAECLAHQDSMNDMMSSLGGMLGMMTPAGGGSHGMMPPPTGGGMAGGHHR